MRLSPGIVPDRIVLSTHGRWVAVHDNKDSIWQIWDTLGWKKHSTLNGLVVGEFLTGEGCFATVDATKSAVWIYDIEQHGNPVKSPDLGSRICSLAPTPESGTVAVGDEFGGVWLWTFHDRSFLRRSSSEKEYAGIRGIRGNPGRALSGAALIDGVSATVFDGEHRVLA